VSHFPWTLSTRLKHLILLAPRYRTSDTAQISPLNTLENIALLRHSVDNGQQLLLQTVVLKISWKFVEDSSFQRSVCTALNMWINVVYMNPFSVVDIYWRWEKRSYNNKMVKMRSSNVLSVWDVCRTAVRHTSSRRTHLPVQTPNVMLPHHHIDFYILNKF